MEEIKYCAFIGQKGITATYELRKAITSQILWHFEQGYNTFFFCSNGSFENACRSILKSVIPPDDTKSVYWVSEDLPKKHPNQPHFEDYDVILPIPVSRSPHESVRAGNLARLLACAGKSLVFCTEESTDSEVYEAYEYAKTQSGKRVVNLYIQSK